MYMYIVYVYGMVTFCAVTSVVREAVVVSRGYTDKLAVGGVMCEATPTEWEGVEGVSSRALARPLSMVSVLAVWGGGGGGGGGSALDLAINLSTLVLG